LPRRRILFIRLSQFKIFLKKILIACVFVSALAFMMLSKADTYVLDKAGGTVSMILNPIIQVMQIPARIVYFGYEKVRDISMVYSQNAKLKEESKKILVLQNRVRTLEAENKILAQMLEYDILPEASYITAKVVAEEGDGFSHSLIVYIGDNKNVSKNQIVLGNESVVGRIEDINGRYARVILLTDISSKIPVIVERNRERAILSGDNTLYPKLLYTALNADIKKGDNIVTSGVAGIFPAGLPVGVVNKIVKNKIDVIPISDIERLEFVKIVDYGVYSDVMNFSQEIKGK